MENLKDRVDKLIEKVDVENKKKKIIELQAMTMNPDFWQDHQKAE